MENQKKINEMIHNMEQIIVGKREAIEFALITLLAGGHLLLEDVPGVGKTTLAKTIAQTIHCGFTRIQFTPDTLPSDVTGLSIYNMQTGKFEYSKGAIMDNIILADEINRTSPKTQASLLEAMEEKQVTVDGVTYPLPKPFMVIATQNPVDYLGTYNLPEAQLDRFMMKISIGYPSASDEKIMADRFLSNQLVKKLEHVVDGATIVQMQKEVEQVKIGQDLVSYITKVIQETRKDNNISLGASPRATIALIRASQAMAYVEGRNYCIPDDIIRLINPVISHRIILSPEARLSQTKVEKVLKNIISKIPIPVLS
ncbi:MoxR family ATPase [Mobilitalea sibirica]|uniref:MoxR family ATPase n=1 Tax=Mobilitalea sibirica TaxID=1462919 RepID=A0A8J7GZ40_9FIRM|nr:MoxR family ATPase [Mobilitalea sibirica]MBH1941034.1 MoxR family ATPase [Mobilitalea sibirica]